jgi:hypothetical protein
MSLSLDEKMLRVLLFLAGIALFIEGCGRDRSSDTVTSNAEAQIPPAPSNAALRLATTRPTTRQVSGRLDYAFRLAPTNS